MKKAQTENKQLEKQNKTFVNILRLCGLYNILNVTFITASYD